MGRGNAMSEKVSANDLGTLTGPWPEVHVGI